MSFLDFHYFSDALSKQTAAYVLLPETGEGPFPVLYLLHGLSGPQARSRLSGLLIGIELAGAKPYWLGQRVKLIGAEPLAASYARALQTQGLKTDRLDATACTLAGLSRLYSQLKGA